MEYQIFKIASVDVMENKINSLIKEGWEPLGGVSGVGDEYLLQAMVRKKK